MVTTERSRNVIAALLLTLLANLAAATEIDRARIEREVMQVLDEYMSTWNRRDLNAWEQTFHFPHFRLASGRMSVLQRAGEQPTPTIWTNAADDWSHSRWERRHLIHVSPDKAHVDTQFTRVRRDGSPLGTYDSLYIVTRENGRWGVKLRSSFAQ
jgi:hypothetical protein